MKFHATLIWFAKDTYSNLDVNSSQRSISFVHEHYQKVDDFALMI